MRKKCRGDSWLRRLYFLIFFDRSCFGRFDFLIFFFFLIGLALDLVFLVFSLVFHMVPVTFRVIKSQKG
jgi:hypothetical protein